MTHGPEADMTSEAWPRLWRMVVVGLCTLILCSCRSPQSAGPLAEPNGSLPPEAFTGAPPWQAQPPGAVASAVQPGGWASGLVVPPNPVGPWAPPGIRRPWPQDEYLRDGADQGLPVAVAPDWEIRGLEPEDTIAHYDTLDGRTLVEPSNRVHIYSPRFGAVRQVVSMVQNEQRNQSAGVYTPTKLTLYDESQGAASSKQQLQADRQIGSKLASTYRTRLGRDVVSTGVGPESFQNHFKAFENVRAIRTGQLVESEMAFLAQGVDAAVAWTHKQAVQIILDRQCAAAEVSDTKLETVYTINSPPGNPKLRLIKVASTQFAEPGDIIDFTLRFDNIGNQPIGNVTVVDNLPTRLVFIPGSAQASVKARFSTEANEALSEALRWEIEDPVAPGAGGIIRFRCRVR